METVIADIKTCIAKNTEQISTMRTDIDGIRSDLTKVKDNHLAHIERDLTEIKTTIALREENRQRFIDRIIKVLPQIGILTYAALAYFVLHLLGAI